MAFEAAAQLVAVGAVIGFYSGDNTIFYMDIPEAATPAMMCTGTSYYLFFTG
jgi:hypothetical protein